MVSLWHLGSALHNGFLSGFAGYRGARWTIGSALHGIFAVFCAVPVGFVPILSLETEHLAGCRSAGCKDNGDEGRLAERCGGCPEGGPLTPTPNRGTWQQPHRVARLVAGLGAFFAEMKLLGEGRLPGDLPSIYREGDARVAPGSAGKCAKANRPIIIGNQPEALP